MRILRILIDEKRRLGAIVVRFYGNASVFQSVCFAVFISSHRTIKHNIKKHNASYGRLQFYNLVKKRNGAFFDDTARLGLYSGSWHALYGKRGFYRPSRTPQNANPACANRIQK
jgi:hypothetical protein